MLESVSRASRLREQVKTHLELFGAVRRPFSLGREQRRHDERVVAARTYLRLDRLEESDPHRLLVLLLDAGELVHLVHGRAERDGAHSKLALERRPLAARDKETAGAGLQERQLVAERLELLRELLEELRRVGRLHGEAREERLRDEGRILGLERGDLAFERGESSDGVAERVDVVMHPAELRSRESKRESARQG